MRVKSGILELPRLTGQNEPREPGSRDKAQPVARYVADMTGQLEAMARGARMELLGYLLAMARAEAENLAREAEESAARR